jgi:exopolyphosphatase / guanosine-5'-triphosphate,3'-diphosphate pyrophosphatase
MNLASIDIGTNAVLLFVINTEGQYVREVLDRSLITRLGEGLIKSGRLSADAMERTVQVLGEYREIITNHDARVVRCFGTSALREAENRDEFIDLVRVRLGIDVAVFSEYEEAYYTYLSVKEDPAIEGDDLVIIDIGGGSTEITRGDRSTFGGFISIPMGTVKLTEKFIHHDPPQKDELDHLALFVREKLPQNSTSGNVTVVGMAGTMTTLAAMVMGLEKFDKQRIHSCPISTQTLEHWIHRLSTMTIARRRLLSGMEPGREDLLLQGMILMREILSSLGANRFLVSTFGARYGVINESIGLF